MHVFRPASPQALRWSSDLPREEDSGHGKINRRVRWTGQAVIGTRGRDGGLYPDLSSFVGKPRILCRDRG